MRKVGATIIGLMTASLGMAAAGAQQSRGLASTTVYTSMLIELACEVPRASRILAAGKLMLGGQSVVAVGENPSPYRATLPTHELDVVAFE